MRLVAGVLLVLISVMVGALVVANADSTRRVWALRRTLAAGTVLTSADLKTVKVRVPDRSIYYSTNAGANSGNPVGKTLVRQLAAGELLPRSALAVTPPATTLTVPLTGDQAPRISRGQLIELWLSSKVCQASVILPSVAVQDVQTNGSSALGTNSAENIVIRVPRDQASRVVTALGLDGTTIRAGLLSGASDPASTLDDLNHCSVNS
jgi:hypothetical protein